MTTTEEITEKNMENGVILKQKSLDGEKIKGFKFWVTQFESLDKAISHFTKAAKGMKTGEEVICGILNSALVSRLRSQATQFFVEQAKDLHDDDKASAADLTLEEIDKLRSSNRIVITEEDAMAYVPGERDNDALASLRKLRDEARKMAVKFKDEGKLELAREKVKQFAEYDSRIKQKEAEEGAKLLALLG